MDEKDEQFADLEPTDDELRTYKEIILSLVPAAAKVAKQALEPRAALKRERVMMAKWVLEESSKLMNLDVDRHEVHVVDHALLAQIEQAQKIMGESNQYFREQQAKPNRFKLEPN